jgi:uncharacterized protein
MSDMTRTRRLPAILALALAALLSSLMLAACGSAAPSDAIPKAPTLERPVVDTTNTLSSSGIDAISKAAGNNAKDAGSPQVAVLMTGSLPDGQTVEQASLKVARAWGVGGKGMKNGVLLYIAKDAHQMRLEVADGVGDKLTDLESSRILDDNVKPLFKADKYAEGIETGVKLVRAEIGGKPGETYVKGKQATASSSESFLLLPLLLIVLPSAFLVCLGCRRGWISSGGGMSFGSGSSSHSSGSSFGGGGGFSGGGSSSSW